MERLAIIRWVRARPTVGDALLAAAVTALTIFLHLAGPEVEGAREVRDPAWWTIVLVVAASVPLVWRRSRPIVTASVILGVQIVCELFVIEGTGWIGVLIAVYSLGAHAERGRVAAASTMFAIIGVLLVTGWLADEIGPGVVIGSSAVLGAAWLFGDNVRRRRLHLDDLAERAERAEREQELITRARVRDERGRLARELHDVVAHSVSVMIIQAGAARRTVATRPDDAVAMLQDVELTGRRAMDELRRVLGVLRSDSEGDEPATLGPQPGIHDLAALIADDPELPVSLTIDPDVHDLPGGVGVSVFRLVQEALTNVRRHAGRVGRVDVIVAITGGVLDVRIDDDGRGAANATANVGRAAGADAGFGIAGMHERASALGGRVTAGPRPGGGWRVHARLPVDTRLGTAS